MNIKIIYLYEFCAEDGLFLANSYAKFFLCEKRLGLRRLCLLLMQTGLIQIRLETLHPFTVR